MVHRKRDVFTHHELSLLFASTQHRPRDHALLTFLVHTGCRRGAARNLLWQDILDSDGDIGRNARVQEKTTRRQMITYRYFDIDDTLRERLQAWRQQKFGNTYVFPRNDDCSAKMGASAVYDWFRRICRQVDIVGDHVHPHALRRTCVTRLLEENNRLEDVSQWIGHRSVDMTMRYNEVDREKLSSRLVRPWSTPANASFEGNQNKPCPDKEDLPSETTSVTSEDEHTVRCLALEATIKALAEKLGKFRAYRAHIEEQLLSADQLKLAQIWVENMAKERVNPPLNIQSDQGISSTDSDQSSGHPSP